MKNWEIYPIRDLSGGMQMSVSPFMVSSDELNLIVNWDFAVYLLNAKYWFANGNYFEFLAQEVRRSLSLSRKYCGHRPGYAG